MAKKDVKTAAKSGKKVLKDAVKSGNPKLILKFS